MYEGTYIYSYHAYAYEALIVCNTVIFPGLQNCKEHSISILQMY